MSVIEGLMLVGGRRVRYCVYNGGASFRAVFEYGTPGHRRLSGQLVSAAEGAGIELLVIDRPGYGSATRRAGRSVVNVVDDVTAVVDSLGWDRFAVWGGSGGAPHALAIAARLAPRVTACASVAGLAPFDTPGLDWFAGMSAGNVEEFRAAAVGEVGYRPLVERLTADALASVESGGVPVSTDYELPDVDRQALAARRQENDYVERMRLTYRDGVDGWVDDCLAFTRPWGFLLSEITVPTSIWSGPDEVLAGQGHQAALTDAIPMAQARQLHAGHVLDPTDLANIYRELTHPSQ